MPTRGQQRSVTKAKILEASVQLFSRQGYNGTGTREIARLASINEATLFRHFRSKKELFWAAIEERLTRIRVSRELLSAASRRKPPASVVPLIFDFILRTMTEQPELIRLLYVSALELPGGDEIYQKHLGPIFDLVSTYVADETSEQKLDPQIVTAG